MRHEVDQLAGRMDAIVRSGVLGRETEAAEIIQDAAAQLRTLGRRDAFFSRYALFAHMEFAAGRTDALRESLNKLRFQAPE